MSVFLVLIGLLYFSQRRLLQYLRYLQQEEYDNRRFYKWLQQNKAFDTHATLLLLCASLLSWLTDADLLISLSTMLAFFLLVNFSDDPRKKGKIKLKMTERATRIYRFSLAEFMLITALITLSVLLQTQSSIIFLLALAIFIQFTPFVLMSANFILQRDENKRQTQFLNEAKAIFAQVNPYVIGITGSYGKTSTKDALGNILQIALGATFWPAKGINTPMGITREIRSRLHLGTSYAVIEMGAYGIGSIKRLCDLTPPHAAIITTIGSAHLERFGSLENIRIAKSELARALPPDGILVCNGDNPGARQIAMEANVKTKLLYGFEEHLGPLDCKISSWITTPKGTSFTIEFQGQRYEGHSPLFGKAALSNVVASFTMACALGCNPELVLAVIRNLEPVDNRLQVRKDGPITYLNDGYNSNPEGFQSALEILSKLPGERRILMTPGMIELGPLHYSENERLGELAGEVCDLALVVGKTNREPLVAGLLKGGLANERIIWCENRDQAFSELATLRRPGDLILIENDLPDLYEARPRF